jgi:hypothetical protein
MHGIWVTQKLRQDAPPSGRSFYKTIELDVSVLRGVDRDDFAVAHCLDVSDSPKGAVQGTIGSDSGRSWLWRTKASAYVTPSSEPRNLFINSCTL